MSRRPITSGIVLGLCTVLVILFGLRRWKTISHKSPDKATKIIETSSGIEMVLIPGGWFSMGSNRGDPDEAPIHKVWVAPFLMDRYEVTQGQYGKLVIGNPSRFKDPRRPVEQIRWLEAILYCNARSLAEGLEPCYDEETGECNFQADGYRLPTEAEWEYACRAGANTDYSFGSSGRALKNYAWYKENASKKTQPIGQKKPNPRGLFDTYGNVAEWCNDKYDKNYYKRSPEKNPRGPADGEKYVIRGGAWNSTAHSCRSAYRTGEAPGSFADACFARPDIGFRCVKNLKEGRKPEPTSGATTTPAETLLSDARTCTARTTARKAARRIPANLQLNLHLRRLYLLLHRRSPCKGRSSRCSSDSTTSPAVQVRRVKSSIAPFAMKAPGSSCPHSPTS